MNIKNNVKVEKLDDFGRGIGYVDNKIIFIIDAMIGEVVDVNIIKETNKYYEGEVIKYIKKSSDRVNVNCPYYKYCGGCNILHMNYDNQIEYKKDKLKNILKKFSNLNIDIDVIKNKDVIGYRNKIELKIQDNRWGYYNISTHNFVEIDKCLLAKDSINKVVENKKYINVNNGSITIRCNYNDEVLLVIKTDDKVNIDIDSLKKNIKLVGIVINDKTYYGENFYYEMINNKLFKVNYNSFFQINNYITKEMINIINDNCSGKILLDLYCGVGFLGQVIDYEFDKIYGIELNRNSVIDAINNAKINKINNTYYMCGNSSKLISNIKENIDTLIIDPPRSGLYKNMVKDVMDVNSDTIIYVSCNPITLGRDINLLKEKYSVNKIYLLDMFSNTYHFESVCLLKKKTV